MHAPSPSEDLLSVNQKVKKISSSYSSSGGEAFSCQRPFRYLYVTRGPMHVWGPPVGWMELVGRRTWQVGLLACPIGAIRAAGLGGGAAPNWSGEVIGGSAAGGGAVGGWLASPTPDSCVWGDQRQSWLGGMGQWADGVVGAHQGRG